MKRAEPVSSQRRSTFWIGLCLGGLVLPVALHAGGALVDCQLVIPDSARIQNYQLLAPQLSWGGTFLAYETLIGERRELHISETTSWQRHQVRVGTSLFKPKESFESELDWFPSQEYENWFVFVTGERNNFDIYLGDASQQHRPMPLIDWDSNDHQPVFSPDGKDLAFISTRGRQEGTDLYVILDIDRKLQDLSVELEPVRLTHSETGVLYPAWSPDGRFLSFTGEMTEQGVLNDGISLIRFGKLRASLHPGEDASSRVEVVRVTGPEVNEAFLHTDEVAASWAPDGSFLAFYFSRHTGPRKGRKAKDEKVEHSVGILQVKSFENDILFSMPPKMEMVSKVLDPNVDSFLRGPVWTLDSRYLLVTKDSPEEDNPIQIIRVPEGRIQEHFMTKLNRDLTVARGKDGLTRVLFSAHDRQTTSVYECKLR